MYIPDNAIIIHGGGLVDPSKEVILRLAEELKPVYASIKIGMYSFESLYNPDFILDYNDELVEELKTKRGTFFGTCRDINLSSNEMINKVLANLITERIRTVIVAGGDGSSRQVAEIAGKLEKHGINIIFAVPLTIDGINGGRSIGIDQAVRESVRQIENIAATSLMTRDKEKFGVVTVELQGRNRDDIIASVLRYFWRQGRVADCKLDEMDLWVVPANYPTDKMTLQYRVNCSDKRTLILVSEGAEVKISDLKKTIRRKVRSLVVGHPSQANEQTTKDDMKRYSQWLGDVGILIRENPKNSFCIVNDGVSCYIEDITYYATLNPRETQIPNLSKGLVDLMKRFMPK